jgi:hypothetical protein
VDRKERFGAMIYPIFVLAIAVESFVDVEILTAKVVQILAFGGVVTAAALMLLNYVGAEFLAPRLKAMFRSAQYRGLVVALFGRVRRIERSGEARP